MSETEKPVIAPIANPTAPTAARPKPKGGGHWYSLDGTPMFEVAKKDGKGMRNTTLADARKLNLLPSVTGILKILHAEALVNWRIEQAALAIVTAPRLPGEADDAFVLRVLHTEEQQEQEGQIARDRGTAIHAAIEAYFNGQPIPDEWAPYVNAPINAMLSYGSKASSEVILVGDDYAGTADLLQDCEDHWRLCDAKSAKRLPDPAKGSWSNHKLQLAAYAKALQQKFVRAGQGLRPIIPYNIYISTEKPGEYVVCEVENWEEIYERGFKPLTIHWQWANNYRPENPNREDEVVTDSQLEKLKAQLAEATQALADLKALAPAPEGPSPTPPPVVRATSVLPPPMGRSPNIQPPPPPARPTPTLPDKSKDGKRLQWSHGVPTPQTPAP